jgi:hypothetical protein
VKHAFIQPGIHIFVQQVTTLAGDGRSLLVHDGIHVLDVAVKTYLTATVSGLALGMMTGCNQ